MSGDKIKTLMWRASLAKVYDEVVASCRDLDVPVSEKVCYSPECEEPPKGSDRGLLIDVTVVNNDAIDTALQLENPLVLNLASPTRPGGGVRAGALAQEEELFRRTAYHKTLNLDTGYYPLQEDEVVYSPNVPVVTDSEYRILEGKRPTVSFIACAGLRWPPHKEGKFFASSEDRETVRKKITTVLRTASERGHSNLVLGALGCGCFRSPPYETALLFKHCLQKYRCALKRVVFAILDRNVAKPDLGPLASVFSDVLVKDV